MYSFAPLENINTVVEHTGFYIALTCTIVVYAITVFQCRNDVEGLGWFTALALGTLGVAALISWNSGEIKNYDNTPVTGQFVNFVAEGYNETIHQGKYTRHVDRHEQYVVYRVEGQNIMLQATVGAEYPQTVVLYKN